MDDAYLDLLTRTTRREAVTLAGQLGGAVDALPHRETMRAVKTLAVADLTAENSRGPGDLVDELLTHLHRSQGRTGLFDGDNLVSPPDSAFTVNDICQVVEIIDTSTPGTGDWQPVARRLRSLAAAALEGLLAGGVHTPNHRWELAAALAGLDQVVGDRRLRPRIEQWLAEGVDVDPAGFFSERSAIYAAVVTGPSLLTLARLLQRPELLAPVRANLATLPTLVDDDGEVVTVHSRRQDQRLTFHLHPYLSLLRRFAITDGDPQLARLARLAAHDDLPESSRHLADALLDPVLLKELPGSAAAPVGQTAWPTVGLVRRRAGSTTSTVFAGADTRTTGRIASGLANSATVFQLRHGLARLRALRISPAFFDTGAFRPTDLRIDGDRLVLTEHRESGYYQPLPAPLRHPDGVYRLDDEGRFFASMDFAHRARSTLRLTGTLVLDLTDDGADLEISWTGTPTRFGIEFVVGEGDLDGVAEHPTAPDTLCATGEVLRLDAGIDRIELRITGHDRGRPPEFDDGEIFGYVHGHDRIPGRRILAGASTDTPVRIRIRGASRS